MYSSSMYSSTMPIDRSSNRKHLARKLLRQPLKLSMAQNQAFVNPPNFLVNPMYLSAVIVHDVLIVHDACPERSRRILIFPDVLIVPLRLNKLKDLRTFLGSIPAWRSSVNRRVGTGLSPK